LDPRICLQKQKYLRIGSIRRFSKIGATGLEQPHFRDQEQSFIEGVVQNPAQDQTEINSQDDPAEKNPGTRNPNGNIQNHSEPDWLVAALRSIPAEFRADFLRALADHLDSRTTRESSKDPR
jgi:hypothetical protein